MKILHISHPVSIPVSGYGGTERMIHSLINEQVRAGHEVDLIAGFPSKISGVTDLSFVKGKNYEGRKSVINRLITGYSLSSIFHGNIKEYDIVHSHISGFDANFFSILSKNPIVTTIHCPMTLHKFGPFTSTLLTKLLPKKTNFLTIGSRSYNLYKKYLGESVKGYVRNGIDASHIPFNNNPDHDFDLQICHFGKIMKEKGQHLAIKIFDILRKQGYNISLNLLGKMSYPLDDYSKNILTLSNERNNVNLLSNLPSEDIFRILGNSDVLINTSYEIGFNIAQLETQATGTPIVGIKNGGAEEIVIEGKNGYMCNSLEDMADKSLEALKLNRTYCSSLVRETYNEHEMYKNYLSYYQALS